MSRPRYSNHFEVPLRHHYLYPATVGKMNWNIVAYSSVAPLAMGPLSLFGLTRGIEPFLWLGFAAIAGVIVSRYVDDRLLVHTLLIGILWGLFNGTI